MELTKSILDGLTDEEIFERFIIDKERIFKSFVVWKRTMKMMYPNIRVVGTVTDAKGLVGPDALIGKWNGHHGIIYDEARKYVKPEEARPIPKNFDDDEYDPFFEGTNIMSLIKEIADDLWEGKNAHGERTFRTHAGWKRAVKKHKADAEFYGDKDIGGAHGVGEWDGETGTIYHKKEVKEEVVTELSTQTLKSYVDKAEKNNSDKRHALSAVIHTKDTSDEDNDAIDKMSDKYAKRSKSIIQAGKKSKTVKVKEEPIVELSKTHLKSYIASANKDTETSTYNKDTNERKFKNVPEDKKNKRNKGVFKALSKLS